MLKVVVDDTTAFMEGQHKELPGIAEKFFLKSSKELEEKGFRLSNTEGRKQWKGRVIASSSSLDQKFQKCSRREGVGLAASVETIRTGPQKESEEVGSEGEG